MGLRKGFRRVIIERVGKGGEFVGVYGIKIGSGEVVVGRDGRRDKVEVVLGVVYGVIGSPFDDKVAVLEEGLAVV